MIAPSRSTGIHIITKAKAEGQIVQKISAMVASTMIVASGTQALAQPVALAMDYPAASLRAGEQGTVRFEVELNAAGKAQSCTIVGSSGYPRLDEATCKQVKKGLFKPGLDANGKPMRSTYSGKLTWKLPARPTP